MSAVGVQASVAGDDPVLSARHRVGGAAAAALSVAGAQAALHHCEHGGPPQSVGVDVVDAATTLLGFALQQAPGLDLYRHRNATIDHYRTADGRWFFLHGGFPHLAAGLLDLLGLPAGVEPEREAVAAAVARRDGQLLEDDIAAAGLCGTLVRPPAEWRDHPQGEHLAELPAVTIERLGEGCDPPRPAGPVLVDDEGARPLDGVRVLDQTRVLAGPTCGRTLASFGAQVLRIGSPQLPSIESFVIDTGHGKRNAFVELDADEGRAAFATLVRGSDVVVQGYRPGALDRLGASIDDLVSLRPGVVVVQVSCYGSTGPWATRRGWEQLAQSVSGMSWAEGTVDANGERVPSLVPAAATDYTTGYLAAAGAIAALRRREVEGGSWLVRASLAQTAMWIQGGGLVAEPDSAGGLGDVAARQVTTPTAWGSLTHLAPVVRMSATPCRWDLPPQPLGASPPTWT